MALSNSIASRRLNSWAAGNNTEVSGERVYGKAALQSLLVDILVSKGEAQRPASSRVCAQLAEVSWQPSMSMILCSCLRAACLSTIDSS